MIFKYFSPQDSKEEAHRKYKVLAKLYHPDQNNGDNTIMREINNEYEFISKGKIPIFDEDVQGKSKTKTTVEDITLGDVIDIASILFGKNEKKRAETMENLLKRHEDFLKNHKIRL